MDNLYLRLTSLTLVRRPVLLSSALVLGACSVAEGEVRVPAEDSRSAESAAVANTPCQSNELVVFACTVQASGERIGICLRSGSGKVYSYFARERGGERAVVRNPEKGPHAFTRSLVSHSRDFGGAAYTLNDNGQTRVLYWLRATNGHREQGTLLMDRVSGKAASPVEACSSSDLVDEPDAQVFRLVRDWPVEPVLIEQGVP